MSHLEVPGASLYHEVTGKGPLLLCISGGDGSCEIWRDFVEQVKTYFTVVLWDRRGFSRSSLTGAQDYARRMETDIDDASRLIKKFSPNEPATVIGNSSGAIISLRLLIAHPKLVRVLVPTEPPASNVLPDYEDLKARSQEVYDLYRQAGPAPALQKFALITEADQAMIVQAMNQNNGPYMFSNMQYWFEREFLFYPNTIFDVDKELGPVKDKLILANGELSPQHAYQCRANATMAEKLGLEVQFLPGEHVGHATHPQQFAQRFLEILRAKDQYYAKA